ncbi:LAFE_0A00694g1_1 [Lachancea fermentati]|uniref:LAFE_0A00694g1_1 n=1 Tax=Lachancea fermentati TaxID=4955 RepID=A0A1G4M6L3_LACFM|nr:LAFE_0A00694g1_1 [Lachancea fermentati]
MRVAHRNGKEILERTEDDERAGFSFLEVVEKVDALPDDYCTSEHFRENVYRLQSHDGITLGHILKLVVKKIKDLGDPVVNELFNIMDELHIVRFVSTEFQERNELLASLCLKLKDRSNLKDLQGWRDESYAVYVRGKPYVLVERAASGLLGVVTYGAHVNGFVRDPINGDIKLWIPRRSLTKATWPGMLDNIIAGGLGYPHGVYETVLKESMEEANLSKEIIEKSIKPVGVVSYFYFQNPDKLLKFDTESSLITPEVEYLYDLELGPDIIPQPNDGEVESFQLLSLQETVTALKNGEFKPNCALITVEFLMRQGYITPENEPNYLRMMTKMHRSLPFPTRN